MKCVATLKDLWAAEQCNISTNSIKVSQYRISMIISAIKMALVFTIYFSQLKVKEHNLLIIIKKEKNQRGAFFVVRQKDQIALNNPCKKSLYILCIVTMIEPTSNYM